MDWFNGKVYNITEYIKYHPAGVDEIMLGAGQDATQMFNEVHRWVSIDAFLGKCYLGPVPNHMLITVIW